MAGPLIGALRVSLSAETSAFEAGMKRSQRQAAQTASSIQGSFAKANNALKAGIAGFLGGISLGAIISAGKAALEYAGSLAEVAQQLGVTAKDLQVFRFAAGQVGVKQEQLETGLSKLTITLGKVAAGAKMPAAALNAIGISVDQLKGKNTGEALRIIADGLQKIPDRAQRAAVEVALFGKSGAMLDNLLSGGSGAINELSAAAEKLGIILSDEQIQNADETADKLNALKTVLSAQIAGIVANNTDAILALADAFSQLVRAAGDAGRELNRLFATAQSRVLELRGNFAEAARARGSVFQSDKVESIPGQSVTIKLPALPSTGARSEGLDIGRFLAGGGGRKARADHSAQDALRDAFQFDQELRRSKIETLRLQQQLATNIEDRTSIGIDILNAEQAAFDAEQRYKVALFNLTKGKEGLSEAQAAQFKLEYDKRDALEREALLQEEEEQRARDFAELDQHDFDRQRELLEARADIAETASERRKIELDLLRITYAQRKQALQNIIDTSKDFKAVEDARRDLELLNKTQPLAEQGVIQRTRGPMEDYLASLPTTAAKLNEAMERLQVEGFEGLIDSVLALSEGTKSATQTFLQTLKAFVLGMARLELQRMLGAQLQSGGANLGGILGAIGSLFGGGGGGTASSIASAANSFLSSRPGFASGGSFGIRGMGGIDRNILSLNGLPIARVSYGERISIGNDNMPRSRSGGRGDTYITVNTPDANSFRMSEGQIARSWKRRMDRA